MVVQKQNRYFYFLGCEIIFSAHSSRHCRLLFQREKEREKAREKEREGERGRGRESKERGKGRERERGREREGERGREREGVRGRGEGGEWKKREKVREIEMNIGRGRWIEGGDNRERNRSRDGRINR